MKIPRRASIEALASAGARSSTCRPSRCRPGCSRIGWLGGAVLFGFVFGFVSATANAVDLLRGDIDEDAKLTLTDAVGVLGFLFLAGPAPYCQPVADSNDDGVLNLTDPVRVLNHLFLAGPALPKLSDAELRECGWGTNLPPRLPAIPVYRAYPGYPIELDIGALDPEVDELRHESSQLPAGATLDSRTGVFRWTPSAANVGLVSVPYTVIDEGRPPNRVEGRFMFQVLPLDACNRPRCDPARGCEQVLVGLAQVCCGDPMARIPDPDVDCPDGAVLHVGRNAQNAATIGRLQNCDRLRLIPIEQDAEGYTLRLNVEARCVDPKVLLRVRIETAGATFLDFEKERDLTARPDGFLEIKGMSFLIESHLIEGMEADLTVNLDDGVVRLERKIRVVLTTLRIADLP
jgi:hypothetical protein